MLDLNTPEASIRIDVINFVRVDDFQCKVEVGYNISSSRGRLEIESCWFYWSGIEEFYNSLKKLLEGIGSEAMIGDLSDEFKLIIKKADLNVSLTMTYTRSNSVTFCLDLNSELDIVNVALRQLSDFIREAQVSS